MLKFMVVLPIGSSSITHDLMSLNIDEDEAEELKVHYGSAVLEQNKDDEETIHLSEEGHSVKLSEINNIVEARATEIIANIWNQIELSGYYTRLGSGLIFTGGGSNLRNLSTAFNKYIKRNPKIRTAQLVYQPSITGAAIPTDGTINALIGMVLDGRENCCDRIFVQPAPQVTEETEETVNKYQEPDDNDEDRGLTVEDDDSEEPARISTSEEEQMEDEKRNNLKPSFLSRFFKTKDEEFDEDPDLIAKQEEDRQQQEIMRERERVEREAQREVEKMRKMEQKKKDDAIKAQQAEIYKQERDRKRLEEQNKREEEKKRKDIEKQEKEELRKEKGKNSKVKKTLDRLTNILFNDDSMNDDND